VRKRRKGEKKKK
jgi:hypothetical protein